MYIVNQGPAYTHPVTVNAEPTPAYDEGYGYRRAPRFYGGHGYRMHRHWGYRAGYGRTASATAIVSVMATASACSATATARLCPAGSACVIWAACVSIGGMHRGPRHSIGGMHRARITRWRNRMHMMDRTPGVVHAEEAVRLVSFENASRRALARRFAFQRCDAAPRPPRKARPLRRSTR